MSRLLALPVLSPDALSSVAYGPEAMMAVLVLAGSAELKLSLPIGAVLVVLMLAVGLGYRQVIRAYPHGGGSYIVAKDSLGPNWGLLAAAGLILDYILTVAVSVAAGVAAITSAIPSVTSVTVPLGLVVIAVLVFGNLRGVKAAGALFAAPTYMFIAAIALIVVVGLVDSAMHGFHAVAPPPRHATEALGVLLILRAFSSGATAMTGIEVISNSVPVFEPPEADNARRTLTIMIALLVSMFIGVVLVAHLEGIAPGTQTVLSQIAHRTLGSGVLYAYVQIATTAILLIAANSAVNGFPRLLYFMARDRYAPMAFLRMGDRLAFTAGIVVLAVPAAILYAAFNGQTEPLIPLFAVGVFVAFTLAQSGMVAHWWHHREHGWQRALAINLVGAVLSGAVAIIAAVTKFVEGAWLVVVLIPLIVLVCLRIHRHYQRAHHQLDAPSRRDRWWRRRRAWSAPQSGGDGHRLGSRGAGRPERDRAPAGRAGRRARPGRAPGPGLRRLAPGAGARGPRQPQRGGGQALSPILEGVGRLPAARGRRLALSRHRRPARQLHRSAAPAAARHHPDRDRARDHPRAPLGVDPARPHRPAATADPDPSRRDRRDQHPVPPQAMTSGMLTRRVAVRLSHPPASFWSSSKASASSRALHARTHARHARSQIAQWR